MINLKVFSENILVHPYLSLIVKSNVGKKFLSLLDKHFTGTYFTGTQ